MNITITCPRAPVTIEWIKIMQRSGHEVTVVDSLRYPISRFVTGVRFVRVPSPRFENSDYARVMKEVIQKSDLVVPTCEDIFYLSALVEGSPLKSKVFAPERSVLLALHNKLLFAHYMNEYVKVPITRLIQHVEEVDLTEKATLLKPVFSRFGTQVVRKVTVQSIKKLVISPAHPWVQQEFIQGTPLCNYAIVQDGVVIEHVVYRPKYLINNAASTYFEFITDDRCERFIQKFAQDTRYTGQVAFDFIDDGADLYVIECNPRATSGLHLCAEGIAYKKTKFTSTRSRSWESCRVGNSIYLMFGPRAILTGRFSVLRRDFQKAKDVLGGLPVYALVLSVFEVLILQVWYWVSFSAATTIDIEYNG